jgi:uncharacterized protein (TIGR03437 family)
LPGQAIITVAGTTWIFRGDQKPALQAPLGNLSSLVVDAAGNIYAADTENHLVVRISPDGLLRVVAGNGFRGFSGDSGPAESSSLFAPGGVAVDTAGNIYIADTLNHRIRRISGGTITTFAGTGVPGSSGEGLLATQAALNAPQSVAVDTSGTVYIADTQNHRVRKVVNGTITTVAGTGVRGFSGDGGPAVSAAVGSPQGLALDGSGNLYFADRDNQRVRKVPLGSGVISTLAGNGVASFSGDNGPAVSASLNSPRGVAVDRTGRVFVADTLNSRIRQVRPDGIIVTVAGSATRGFAGDGASATNASLNLPQGLAVDALGNVLMADTGNNRVRALSVGGTISTLAGSGSFKFSGDGGPSTSATLNSPRGVISDSAGNLYVVDSANHRVRRINALGVITTLAGTGLPAFSGDGGAAVSAALNSPAAVAIDSVGNFYIADASNNRVRVVSVTGTINTLAGSGTGGFSGDNGPAIIANLNQPQGIAVDLAGNVYVADTGNHRVRKITPAGAISTVAGSGIPGFSGDGAPGTTAMLDTPTGLAVDGIGNLYIADSGNHRIRKLSPSGTISTVVGSGAAGSGGDGGPATTALLNSPRGVSVSSAGDLFIAEVSGHRIRKVSGGTINTLAGKGVAGFEGDGGLAANAILNQPFGVAVDSTGNAYIADTLNDRIRGVLTTPPTFVVSPQTLSFSEIAGGPGLGAQLVEVASLTTGLAWTATKDSSASWLSLSPTSGVVPGSFSVSLNLTGLPPGDYQATITVASPLANPSSQTIRVTLTVRGSDTPQLTVDPASVVFEAPAGSGNLNSQSLRIGNGGRGTINWTASSEGAGNWLSVSPSTGQAVSTAAGICQVRVDVGGLVPGVYSGTIRINTDVGQQKVIAVTLLLAQDPQAILLSQSGLLFTGVEGGGVIPEQSFGVLNIGQGIMNWTAEKEQTVTGEVDWLNVTPPNGISVANSLDVPLVNVRANAGSRPRGRYSGLVRIRALAANNSPQPVTVDMNVLPTGSTPSPVVRPTGLIFVAREGSSSPSSQLIRLATAGKSAIEVRAGVLTLEGGNWFDVLPRNLSLSPGETATLTVQPNLGSLRAGQYRASVTLLFSDGSPSQVVNVLFVVVAPLMAATAQSIDGGQESTVEPCVAGRVLTIIRSPGLRFAQTVGLPLNLEVQVTDDCGQPVTNATVVATFTNGDAPLNLANLRNGLYAGTWRPAIAATTSITVGALAPPLLAGEDSVTGQTQGDLRTPLVGRGGVVDGASFTPDAPVAPGSIISLFGRNLANDTRTAQGFPLPRELAGAKLTISGREAPLFFSSRRQINAQLPVELAASTRVQIEARFLCPFRPCDDIDDGFTISDSLTLAAARPAIFSADSSGKGQGAVVDIQGRLVDVNAAASPGDIVQVFCTGLGPTMPAVATGERAPANDPLARVTIPVEAVVAGKPATVTYAGLAPGFVGLYQVNVQIPEGTTPGLAVPIMLSQNGVTSNQVTLVVR